MKTMMLVPLAAVVLAGEPAVRQEQQPPLRLSAVRFYGPGATTTTIEVLGEVRPAAIQRSLTASRFRLIASVMDSGGLELQRTEWSRELAAQAAGDPRTTLVESFGFAAAAGVYRIRIQVVPEQGTAVQQELEVRATAGRPPASDLVLATQVRAADDSSRPSAGEIRRGQYLLSTAPVPRLNAEQATLNWYAEVYRASAPNGQLVAEVVGSDGQVIVRTPARALTVGAAGAATTGALDLAGLPEGTYRLRLVLPLADTTMRLEAPFAMSSMAALAVASANSNSEPADLFEGASEARLDSLFAPLVFLADEMRQGQTYNRLTIEGKRRFLRQFWQTRDPSPATVANERRDEFYRAVAIANERYGEAGRGEVPGWNTDRGRIFLRNGTPDEVLHRPSAHRPYEAWKYTRGQQRYYLFIDQTGLGNYALEATNDNREPSRPNWETRLGREITQDVYRFLGRTYDPFADVDPD